MEAEPIHPLKEMEESLQKELDLINEDKPLKIEEEPKDNIFKTEAEADEFLNTAEAKEKKMVKWKIREECYMVDTEERVKTKKKTKKALDKIPEPQRGLSLMLGMLGVTMGIGFFFMHRAGKRKVLELKLKYINDLQTDQYVTKPSEKILSILEKLADLKYESTEITSGNGGMDVWISLFGIKSSTLMRQNLDAYHVKVHVCLKPGGKKVRHIGFKMWDARRTDKSGYAKMIDIPGKTGAGGEKLGLKRLKRALDRKQFPPSRSVRDLWALSNIPNLRTVLPPVEGFLRQLYPKLFRVEDYKDWKKGRIKKTLDEVIALEKTLAIPPKQPLAIGVDETRMVMDVLIKALKRWHREKRKKKKTK